MLSAETLQEFKEIYEQEFDVELSDAEVELATMNLLMVLDHIYHPIPKDFPAD